MAEEVAAMHARIAELDGVLRHTMARLDAANTAYDTHTAAYRTAMDILNNKYTALEAKSTHTGGNGKVKSIMDCKGFTRITVFKGVGWIKWRNQFMTLARLAHPRIGHKLLKAAAAHTSTIDDVQLFTPADIPYEDADEFSTDLVSTFGFLVEG